MTIALSGPGAKARFSVLLESAYLAADATLTGAILCSGASVKRGGSMFEGSAVGTQAVVGAGASVRPDVLICLVKRWGMEPLYRKM